MRCADSLCHAEGCSEVVRVGLRFEGQERALATTEIKKSDGEAEACISSTDLVDSPIDMACGSSWSLCISFARLQIGSNFISGCPTIMVKSCTPLWPPGAPAVSLPLPLDCFETGFECARETDCDTCIANGCGWCASDEAEGADSAGKCMEGNVWGPLCDECGANCSCAWNYGKCPMKRADMALIRARVQNQMDALENVSSRLNRTFDSIANGDRLDVAGDEYQCETHSAQARAKAWRTTVTILVSVCLLAVSLLLGCIAGKTGVADQATAACSHGLARCKNACFPQRQEPDNSIYAAAT